MVLALRARLCMREVGEGGEKGHRKLFLKMDEHILPITRNANLKRKVVAVV